MQYMQQKQKQARPHREAQLLDADIVETKPWKGPTWDRLRAQQYVLNRREKCFIVLDDFLLDVTTYMKEHVSFS
jgi:cytochrome b involved in lipid metabolism